MSLQGTVWEPIGPSALKEGALQANGQVTAIAVNPNNPKVMFIGTAWGGVWRTSDGGTTWTPLFDRALSLGIGDPGALAIDPVDTSIVYAGTSSREGSQFASTAVQPQAGLFKSTDGGGSWIRLGSGYPAGNTGNAGIFVSQRINVVLVDPADHQTVYLATSSGFFRSTDGGLNWTAGAGASGDMRSLQLDPTSPPAARILFGGISGLGAVRSTNGGRSFSTCLSAATPAVATKLAGGSLGKVVIALAPPTSPANPGGIQVLYASMVGFGGAPDPVGLFVSKDQGQTWTAKTATALPTNTQGGYSFHMAVDPASPGDGAGDVLYVGAVRQAKSVDAGGLFTGVGTGLHADTHTWAFIQQPALPSVVFCGNDGGIYRSTNGGTTWTSLNLGGFQTCLFYNIDMKPDATVTVGALQDNGVATTSGVASPGWAMTAGGDGWDAVYDGQIAKHVYASNNGQVLRSTNDGASFSAITPPGATAEISGNLSPMATDPSTGGVVYLSSSQHLWQSTDGGATWPKTFPFPSAANHVDVAPANGNNVVVAMRGKVFVSTNATTGLTFTDITRNLPGLNVARAMFDPGDPATVYAVLSGFGGAGVGHVFRTTLAASAWTDISPALDLPCNAIALDGTETPTALYVGTDFGVLQSVDGGATWSILDDLHLPRVPVFDLALRDGVLRAGTFGRGAFTFAKPVGPVIAVDAEAGLAFGTVCSGPVRLALKIFNVGTKNLLLKSVQRLMGSTAFAVLASPGTPLSIPPGEQIDFEVEYTPSSAGTADRATIRISSNDPAAPFVDLTATGTEGTPRLSAVVADTGHAGRVCVGSFVDQAITLNNSGHCPLSVTDIHSSSPEFLVPHVASYPLTLAPGASLAVPIRFQPASAGAKAANITVTSDDPAGPHLIALSGEAPTGKLAVTGSTYFGGVPLHHEVQRTVSICNVGGCDLHVASVAFKHPRRGFRLLHDPFPASVRPGSSLDVVIRYQATLGPPRPCELVVTSDDPLTPVRTVEVIAWAHRDDDLRGKDRDEGDDDET